MRACLALVVLTGMFAAACASSADAPLQNTPVPATREAGAPSAAPATTLPAEATTTVDDLVEVTGVVGAVDENSGVIEIRPTGSGTVTRIEVAPGASIRLATGGSLSLEEIRSSDRIIASGVPGDAPDSIVADTIEVSRVIPGAAPGG